MQVIGTVTVPFGKQTATALVIKFKLWPNHVRSSSCTSLLLSSDAPHVTTLYLLLLLISILSLEFSSSLVYFSHFLHMYIRPLSLKCKAKRVCNQHAAPSETEPLKVLERSNWFQEYAFLMLSIDIYSSCHWVTRQVLQIVFLFY
jgi:hypothetical protein